MKLWIDAQISPAIAAWINRTFDDIDATQVRALGLRDAEDPKIFKRAQKAQVVVMSKDHDFVRLVTKHGPPPQVIWIRCGNTSNAKMREILSSSLSKVIELLESGENVVEINDK
ncbi:MAG: DUF5615 family PIN-like protein [Balneolaceae bacterium]|nr:DUF5615 family PIN-like protein [Balneolaceae bacterium]